MKKRIALSGMLIGIINILLGSCGGIIAVESLKYNSLDQKKAHATSIAVILPLTIFSTIIYYYSEKFEIGEATIYMIPGVVGAIIGSVLLPKINGKLLRKIFSGFILYAGVRMFFK